VTGCVGVEVRQWQIVWFSNEIARYQSFYSPEAEAEGHEGDREDGARS
jgi:hypothetical protein